MKWFIASLLVIATSAQAASWHLPPVQITCTVAGQTFSAHVAATDRQRARGFAGAPPAAIQHDAILFVYPPKGARIGPDFSFGGGANRPPSGSVSWYFNMRHMKAPLDIAFLDADARVLAVLRMVPGTRLYRPDRPYVAALEIAAGRAAKLSLHPGAMLKCNGKAEKK
jgi:uncharacterized membrane protein (UPF0127 family)